MAFTTAGTNTELIKYARDVWARGYIRENRLVKYQGTGVNSIIRLVKDLAGDGKQINVPLVDILNGSGKGSGTLVGNEEGIDNYGCSMWADWLRHAVAWDKATNKDNALNFKSLGVPMLNQWYKRKLKEETIDAMLSIPTNSTPTGFRGVAGARVNGIKWSDATAGNKNSWVTANSDRVVFGSQLSNYSATFATAAGNVDTTNDRMSANVVSLMKRVAMSTTSNKITPVSVGEDMQEMYVLFVGSKSMRDLRNDSAIQAAMREMIVKSEKGFANPLFRNGDIWWDNVLITEIPEIDERLTLSGIGAASSDVVPAFLCGASAMALVTGQMPRPTQRNETDYEFLTGLGIEGQYGIGKVAKVPAGGSALKDWGIVTGFVSAVADA